MKLLFLALALSAVTAYKHTPTCQKKVFCDSKLLHHVQMSRIFPDSKTFVDFHLKKDEQIVLKDFDLLLNQTHNKPTKDQVSEFVNRYFDSTSELENWTPKDFNPQPAFLGGIKDAKLRQFAKDVVGIWPTLGRKVKSIVFEKPELFSLIPVHNGFIIPGGRFKELYYWDSYWIMEGLLISGMKDTVKGMISNLIELQRQFGHIPNGARWYYQERSQPPLLSAMMAIYLQETNDIEFLRANIDAIESELQYWLDTHSVVFKVADKEYSLLRYYSPSDGPRPESYYEDYTQAQIFESEQRQKQFYTDLKSAAESGWDFSSRWFISKNGSNTGNLTTVHATDIIPVDLNAIFANALQNVAQFHSLLHDARKGAHWGLIGKKWSNTIKEVLWNQEDGIWYDFDLTNSVHRKYFFASNVAPLWMGVVEPEFINANAQKILAYLKKSQSLEFPGGVPASLSRSGEQWDYPNGWPPLVSLVVNALEALQTKEASKLAFNVAQSYVSAAYKGFLSNKQLYEKYDVESPGKIGGGGEYVVQPGFGWTNGVILEMLAKYGESMTTPHGYIPYFSQYYNQANQQNAWTQYSLNKPYAPGQQQNIPSVTYGVKPTDTIKTVYTSATLKPYVAAKPTYSPFPQAQPQWQVKPQYTVSQIVPQVPTVAKPELPSVVKPELPSVVKPELPTVVKPELIPQPAIKPEYTQTKPEYSTVGKPEYIPSFETKPEYTVVSKAQYVPSVQGQYEQTVQAKPEYPALGKPEYVSSVPSTPEYPKVNKPVYASPAPLKPEYPASGKPEYIAPVPLKPEYPALGKPEYVAPVPSKPEYHALGKPEYVAPVPAKPEYPALGKPEYVAPVPLKPEYPALGKPEYVASVPAKPEYPALGKPEYVAPVPAKPEYPALGKPEYVAPVPAKPEYSALSKPEYVAPVPAKPEYPALGKPEYVAPVPAKPEYPALGKPEYVAPVPAKPENLELTKPEYIAPVPSKPVYLAQAKPEYVSPVPQSQYSTLTPPKYTSAPLQAQYSTSAPLQGQYSTSAPLQGQYSTSAPLQGQYSTFAPLQGQYSTFAPLPGQYSTSAPLKGQYPTSAPLQGQYSTFAPLQGQYSTSAPLKEQYSTSAPLQGQYSTFAPVQGQYSTSAPLKEQYSTIAPAQEQYSTIAPVQEQYSTIAPVQSQYPTSAPREAFSTNAPLKPEYSTLAPHLSEHITTVAPQSDIVSPTQLADAVAKPFNQVVVQPEHIHLVQEHKLPLVNAQAPIATINADKPAYTTVKPLYSTLAPQKEEIVKVNEQLLSTLAAAAPSQTVITSGQYSNYNTIPAFPPQGAHITITQVKPVSTTYTTTSQFINKENFPLFPHLLLNSTKPIDAAKVSVNYVSTAQPEPVKTQYSYNTYNQAVTPFKNPIGFQTQSLLVAPVKNNITVTQVTYNSTAPILPQFAFQHLIPTLQATLNKTVTPVPTPSLSTFNFTSAQTLGAKAQAPGIVSFGTAQLQTKPQYVSIQKPTYQSGAYNPLFGTTNKWSSGPVRQTWYATNQYNTGSYVTPKPFNSGLYNSGLYKHTFAAPTKTVVV